MVASSARVAVLPGARDPALPVRTPSWTAQTMALWAQEATALPSENSPKTMPPTSGEPAMR